MTDRTEIPRATQDGLDALGREAQHRERERRQAADAEALATMSDEQIWAARWSGLSPSEYMYWAERR